MGVCDLPRAVFRGFTYWNPSTMNNNDYQPTYDPATATLDWSWLERHGLSDAAGFDAYVTQNGILPTANSVLNPNIDPTAPPAEWNFHGDNACGFVQPEVPRIEWPEKFSRPCGPTRITGFVGPDGRLVTQGDPWIDLPVGLNLGLHAARLVDVDPTCPWSSQIFADTVAAGPEGQTGFQGRTAARAHSRWVTFTRNLGYHVIAGMASSMWQFGLPADGLELLDADPSPTSLCGELRAALRRPGIKGLMVRFVTYHTVYFQGAAFDPPGQVCWATLCALYAEYAEARQAFERGERAEPPPRPVNRAYSDTVGWIAPWREDELSSMAVGRTLYPAGPIISAAGGGPPVSLGPAVAEYAVDPDDPELVARISLDLGSTVPELDGDLEKVDVGPLGLALDPGDDTPPVPFAEIPYVGGYDRTAYEAGGGVVDIPAAEFLTGPLRVADLDRDLWLTATLPGTDRVRVALREVALTAQTDNRGVYLDEPGEAWSQPRATISVQVRHHGDKPLAGTRLRVAQYAPDAPGFGASGWKLVSDTDPAGQSPYVALGGPGGLPGHDAATTLLVPHVADGRPYATVTVDVAALRPGPPIIQFHPFPRRPANPVPPAAIGFLQLPEQFFSVVRVRPFHNAAAVAFENWLRTGPSVDLVTQRVFDAVFRTFWLMYPVMRFIADPLGFQAWRGPVLAATDPARFDTAAYMPVMRSLSAGQRRMLELWSAYLNGTLPTPVPGGPRGRRG